jgi:hypothetical protein
MKKFFFRRGDPLAGLLLLLLAGAACYSQPAIREVTVVQTVLQTLEVTRIVEVPVTVTPTPTSNFSPTYTSTATDTPTPSPTPTPTITPTYSAPMVRVLMHSACLYGPGVAYLFKYDLFTGTLMNVLGWQEILSQNKPGVWEPTVWLYIQAIGGTNPCWILSSLVEVVHGNINDTPQYTARLPYSQLYEPPKAVDAWRNGNEVTVMWSSVWMTEDDYRGYLVEAWVCHAGQIYFAPVNYIGVNIAHPGLIFQDEPGCSQPSSGRVYTVEKHGYTQWRIVPWPSF